MSWFSPGQAFFQFTPTTLLFMTAIYKCFYSGIKQVIKSFDSIVFFFLFLVTLKIDPKYETWIPGTANLLNPLVLNLTLLYKPNKVWYPFFL